MTAQGFVFSPDLTTLVRQAARAEESLYKDSRGQHIYLSMMVFINPKIASLPRHDHLMAGYGCYSGNINNAGGGVDCKDGDKLPLRYQSLLNCKKNVEKKEEIWQCERNEELAQYLRQNASNSQ